MNNYVNLFNENVATCFRVRGFGLNINGYCRRKQKDHKFAPWWNSNLSHSRKHMKAFRRRFQRSSGNNRIFYCIIYQKE